MSLINDKHSTVLLPLTSCKDYTYYLVNTGLEVDNEVIDRLLRSEVTNALDSMDDVYGDIEDTYRHILETIESDMGMTFVKLNSKGQVKGLMILVECSSIHHLNYYGTYVNYNVEGSYIPFYRCVRDYLQSLGVETLMVSKRVGQSYNSRFINL